MSQVVVGIGPVLAHFRARAMVFQFRLLPLVGYVVAPGMLGREAVSDPAPAAAGRRWLSPHGVLARLAFFVAGPAASLLLALVLWGTLYVYHESRPRSHLWYLTERLTQEVDRGSLARLVEPEGPRGYGVFGLVLDGMRAFRAGAGRSLEFLAILSLSIALFNMLPIPPLDGGRMLLVLVEPLLRRPLSAAFVINASLAGAALIVLGNLALLFADVAEFLTRR